ncbi:hypothetical protein LFREDSHE_46790 [Shewanella baltica]
MLVVSNYPQVPLATTNVATDSARVDNQLKPVVIPPQAATKGHEERAFNPQNERTADQTQQQTKTLENNQQQVQEKQQQQQSSQQQSQQQQEKKAPLWWPSGCYLRRLKLLHAVKRRCNVRISA